MDRPSRPNILLVTTDQQRFDTIAAHGNSEIYTPHLNWLADEGISFRNCYSACPLCMPARATLMTGLEAHHHGLTANRFDFHPMAGKPTLPGVLTQNGYQTKAVGKMHFEPMRTCYGFEHMELPMDYFKEMRRQNHTSTRAHGVGENEMEPVLNHIDERDTLTHWTVERSMDFLETRDPTRPFFLWTSFAKPHPPLDPLPAYWNLYAEEHLTPPVEGDWIKDPEKAPLGFYEKTFTLNNVWRMSRHQMLQIKRAYYACISQIDYNLGLLFARLREKNLLENTWIIFTSDHGEMLGDHRMGAKYTFFEGSAHVPLIIKPPAAFGSSVPGMAGTECYKLATLADIMPTILALCGVDGPEDTDGVDLLSYAKTAYDREFYGNCENTCFAVMEQGVKYTWTGVNGDELLFDLKRDPTELHDLSHESDYQEIKRKLKGTLIKMVKEQASELIGLDGSLIPRREMTSHHMVSRFPGLNTTLFPRDSFH